MLGTRDPSGKVRSIDLVPLDEERILSTSLIDALSAGTLQDQKVVSYNADSGQIHFADGFASFLPVAVIATSLHYDASAAKQLHDRPGDARMVTAAEAVADFRRGMP